MHAVRLLNDNCTSNKSIPWLTKESAAAITRPDSETTLAWHMGCGRAPASHSAETALGHGKAQPPFSRLAHHYCNRHCVCQPSLIYRQVFGMCSDIAGPYRSLWFNLFFWPLQDFLWAPSPRTDYCCFAKPTSLSIWSPNTKRASRPQQFSKQYWLHLLEVKKQLLKAHWWQNIQAEYLRSFRSLSGISILGLVFKFPP